MRKRMEPPHYYAAILFLRRGGVRVVRAGRWMARVNGKLLKASDVIRLADSLRPEVIVA